MNLMVKSGKGGDDNLERILFKPLKVKIETKMSKGKYVSKIKIIYVGKVS